MIGPRIKYLRKAKSLTLKALAEQLDTSASYLSEVERDVKKPGLDLIISLKRFFGVSTDWLLSDESVPLGAAEEEAPYGPLPLVSPEEKEYMEKLLDVLRNPATKEVIKQSIDTYLQVPRAEAVRKKNKD